MIEAEILGRHMVVEGFKDVRIKDIDAFLNLVREKIQDCAVQFFDAKMVGGFDHLYFATLNALKALKSGLSISKNLALEVLLFSSGQHQIRKALELLGIKPDSSEIVVLILADTRSKAVDALNHVSRLLGGKTCEEVIELTDEKVGIIKEAFGLTDLEIEAAMRESEKEALVNILIERAALLVTQR